MNQIPDIPETPEEFRQEAGRLLHRLRLRLRFLWRRLLPPIEKERRAEVQVQLRDASTPDFDYFVMVLLSCVIATFGLLIDSAATIIGAMLVAPLMSPILGLGLASIRGDTLLLRNATSALLRGAVLAILLSTVVTWINSQLPFIILQELPGEVLARTRPSPIDLGVALAGGLAATFALAQPQLSAALPGVAIATALMPPLCTVGVGIALGRWDVAGGAFLLFLTNSVTIAASAIFLFFALGFSPPRREGEGRIPQSLQISALLTVILLAPLAVQSVQFVQQASRDAEIRRVVEEELGKLQGVEFVAANPIQVGDTLNLEITVRTIQPLSYEDSVALQEAVDVRLQQQVELKINQVFAARLDPRVPPTLTPTPLPGATDTPSPTASLTPTPSLTATPSATATPTATPTNTPTPALAVLSRVYGAGVSLRQFPGGPSIGFLSAGNRVTVLYGYEIYDGWVWIEVQDAAGRRGWIPQFYTVVITLTPTHTLPAPALNPDPETGGDLATPSPTASLTPTP